MTRLPRAIAALAALCLLAVACGSDGGAVELTIVTHDSFALSEEVLQGFEDETGISVRILQSGDAGVALNQAILTKDNPQGDVFFGVDNTFLTRALDEDLFVAYESPGLVAVDDVFELDDQHRVTPIDYGDVCLNYDKAWFADRGVPVPDTLEDLTAPTYDGLLVVENPATSSPGLAFALATIARFGEGDDGWLSFWSQLRDNDVLVSQGWEDAYYGQFTWGSEGAGDRPLVVSYASSPSAEVVFAEETLDEAPTGVLLDSCYRQVEFAGILAGTGHRAEAELFIDFMLSKEFQEDIPLQMFVFPVNGDAALPEVFVEHAELADEPLELAPDRIGAGRDDWIEEWTDTVIR